MAGRGQLALSSVAAAPPSIPRPPHLRTMSLSSLLVSLLAVVIMGPAMGMPSFRYRIPSGLQVLCPNVRKALCLVAHTFGRVGNNESAAS